MISTPPPTNQHNHPVKPILITALVILGLWFAFGIIRVLFLFFFAIVLTVILNAPPIWLERKKIPRTAAALMIFFAMLLFLGVLAWLVIPRILEQISPLEKSQKSPHIKLYFMVDTLDN